MSGRRLFVALLLACLTPANAQAEPPHAAIGDWVGQVEWSDPRVIYSWQINRDGTFSSGRHGRDHDGGGTWNATGAHLTLKYEDGFRYEGALEGDSYSGDAYRTNGRRLGGFSMSRVTKRFIDGDPAA